MNKTPVDAVIFDLDGVITDSTPLHSLAWKTMFDNYLKKHAEEARIPFREFTHEEDYLAYVDGKPRYKGVESFLESRGIELPYGSPEDPPEEETICGLGNLKNQLYNQFLQQYGVEIYATTVELVHEIKAAGIPLGVASSSRNAEKVLELTGLIDLFDTVVDGRVSEELGLRGKPSPDIFLTACEQLGASHDHAVIVEDANSGVQAGFRGNFGLVIGVARENNQLELDLNGADIVVEDLLEITLHRIENWFAEGIKRKQWSIEYTEFDLSRESTREVLCTVGNGFFGTRGAFEEIDAIPDVHYPGTYITGLYNRLDSHIAGRTVTNEDLVNCPNWLPLTFKINTGEWFDPQKVQILEFHRQLDFKTGVLQRRMIVRDREGHQTLIQSWRLASMKDPHLAALRYQITPLNYARTFTVRSELDGTVINQGVKRYRELSSRHLDPLEQTGEGGNSLLAVKTNRSEIVIAEAARLVVRSGEMIAQPEFLITTTPGKVSTSFEIEARSDSPLTVDKIVSLHASHLSNGEDPIRLAEEQIHAAPDFERIQQESIQAWREIWEKIDILVSGDRLVQKMIRLNLYHTLVSASPHSANYAMGIPARGLHGEAYRGHIFWDELYAMPFFDFHFQDTAQAALRYRYDRLDAAQQLAEQAGYQGAMFPWQSGSEGTEETQRLHLNPISGKWGPDHSHLQRHVSLAIAYNVWQHFWITNDVDFLESCSAELYLEICRFWSSIAEFDPETGRYSIDRVMGPDEFHEKYPGAEEGGLRNNAYTNLMAAWVLDRAFDLLEVINGEHKDQLLARLKIDRQELDRWQDLTRNLTVPISDEGIIEQFEGYFDLDELDWDHYESTYEDIHRMDRILKAEGRSPDSYKVAKQADVLMLFYNLSELDVFQLLSKLGYHPPDNLLEKNFHYYLQRTSHGSTLSRLVHAYLAHQVGNYELSWKLYLEALRSDFMDIQGGTTREGIHLGVMTGSALFTLRTYAGINWVGDVLSLVPDMPAWWSELAFQITFRGDQYLVAMEQERIRLQLLGRQERPVFLYDRKIRLKPGEWQVLEY